MPKIRKKWVSREELREILIGGELESITHTHDDEYYTEAEVDALLTDVVEAAAVLADHTLIRGDGGARGVQDTGIIVDDSSNMTLPNGASFSLQEDITFTGATAQNLIKFPDNLPTALDFREAGNSYLKFVSTNGSEAVIFSQNVGIGVVPGNALHVAGNIQLNSTSQKIHSNIWEVVSSIADMRFRISSQDAMIIQKTTRNIGIGTATFGTSMFGGLAMKNAIAPTGNVADCFQMYSADFAGGNACPYFRTEDGTVIGLNQSLLTTDSPEFARLIVACAAIGDDERGLSSIHTLSANPAKSDGIAFYCEGHIGAITTDGPTYGAGTWLNIDPGATLGGDVRALDIGIYEAGADCSGGNAYGLAIHLEFDDTDPPAGIYAFRINCNDTPGHATPAALIFAPNKKAIGLITGNPGTPDDAYLKIVMQGGDVYRIPLVKE